MHLSTCGTVVCCAWSSTLDGLKLLAPLLMGDAGPCASIKSDCKWLWFLCPSSCKTLVPVLCVKNGSLF